MKIFTAKHGQATFTGFASPPTDTSLAANLTTASGEKFILKTPGRRYRAVSDQFLPGRAGREMTRRLLAIAALVLLAGCGGSYSRRRQ